MSGSIYIVGDVHGCVRTLARVLRRAGLERLRARHRAWLASHPAMWRVGDVLLVHADSATYGAIGDAQEAVNAAVAAIVASADDEAWEVLCACLTAREAFLGPQGALRARAFLRQFGGARIVHGHTPIPLLLGCAPERVREPYVYADGLCVNVDGGMMLGGPGFVYRVDQPEI